MIGATDKLKEFIVEKLNDDVKKNLDKYARFANSAIDRIVRLPVLHHLIYVLTGIRFLNSRQTQASTS